MRGYRAACWSQWFTTSAVRARLGATEGRRRSSWRRPGHWPRLRNGAPPRCARFAATGRDPPASRPRAAHRPTVRGLLSQIDSVAVAAFVEECDRHHRLQLVDIGGREQAHRLGEFSSSTAASKSLRTLLRNDSLPRFHSVLFPGGPLDAAIDGEVGPVASSDDGCVGLQRQRGEPSSVEARARRL